MVAFPLLEGEGDEEGAAVGRQFGHGGHHPEVGVAFLEVEVAQRLAVHRQPVRVVGVDGGEEAVPGAFARDDLAAQRAVAERRIADEVDAPDLGDLALVDFEDQIDAILFQRNHLRLDGGGEAAAATVYLEDAPGVVLNPRLRIDHARPELHLGLEGLVVDALVAFEGELVDDRVLHHLDHQFSVSSRYLLTPSGTCRNATSTPVSAPPATRPVANRLFSARSMRSDSNGSPGTSCM